MNIRKSVIIIIASVLLGCTMSSTENNADEVDSAFEKIPVDTDSATDTGQSFSLLRIEAECAFGAATGDCDGAVEGGISEGDMQPILISENTAVSHVWGGSWLSYSGVTLCGYNHATVRIMGAEGGTLQLRLDAPDGQLLAVYELPEEAEAEWQEVTFRLYRTQFEPEIAHTLYVVGDGSASHDQGSIDWLQLSNETPEMPYLDDTLDIQERAADLLSRMTIEEKAGQMAQGSVVGASPLEAVAEGLGSVLAGGGEGPVPYTPFDWYEHTRTYHETVISRSRLRIPIIYGIDAVHGHAKVSGATIFPHNIGMGATRDSELAREMGEVVAKEMMATGCQWSFGPAVSVARDERWGRTYESYGEHPEIASMMTAIIDGMQGERFSSPYHVIATAKHFLGDGGTVFGTSTVDGGTIDQGDAQMSESAFRALHLQPYLFAIDRGVGAIMPSYSSFNGEKMHGSEYWLTNVLRSELEFDGFIISDWDAILQLSGSFSDAVRIAINAGIDMAMFPYRFDQFVSFVSMSPDNGIPVTRIDDAVTRILTAKFKAGLFENPYGHPELIDEVFSDDHRSVARRAVHESLVLLKNENNFLPLTDSQTVCLTGSGADSLRAQMGGWTLGWQTPYNAARLKGDTILDALTTLLTDSPGSIVETGCDVGIRVVVEELVTYAEYLGDDGDPAHDNTGECDAAFGCVVIVLGGRPMNIEELLSDENNKAVVMAWYPGSEGGGIIDVLYGVDDVNFSGTLPMTWKVDNMDEPINYCDATVFGQCDDVGEHYSDASNLPDGVLFPYGYGLTY